MSRFHKLLIVAAIPMIFVLGLWFGSASASEGGASTYRLGFNDLNTGMLPTPGTTTAKTYFLFQDSELIAHNKSVEVDSKTHSFIEMLLLSHVTDWTILGAHYGFAGVFQSRIVDRVKAEAPIGGLFSAKNLTVGGFGDMILFPLMLNWNFHNFHLMTCLAGYVPSGSYSKKRIVSVGNNRWAIEPRVGITWADPDHGRQASILTGYTVNARNSATDYRSGDEFHVDFATIQNLSHGLALGASGYALQQTTPDTGSGTAFGSFRQRVLALGPMATETVKVAGHPLVITLKYDFEFAAQNRSTGDELWLNAGLSF